MSKYFAIVEKENHLAVHGVFDTRESAETHLRTVIPDHISRSYFMNKTLTDESFEIISWGMK